jgi:hypothetical protein
VVANSWKDSEDKLMPVKQWLDERRVMQVIRTHYEPLSDKYLPSRSIVLKFLLQVMMYIEESTDF